MLTILVVDDEEMVLGLCKRVLADFSGLHVLSATRGRRGSKCGWPLRNCRQRVAYGHLHARRNGRCGACGENGRGAAGREGHSHVRLFERPLFAPLYLAIPAEAVLEGGTGGDNPGGGGNACRLPVVGAVVNQDRFPPPERKPRRPALSGSATEDAPGESRRIGPSRFPYSPECS